MTDHGHDHTHPHTVKDPVCGMDVDPTKTAHRTAHAGATHYMGYPEFCSRLSSPPPPWRCRRSA